MFAACKAALSGLGQSAGGIGGGRSSSPSDKQVEAFVRAMSECRLDAVATLVSDSRGALLLGPLRCHPARASAWHLAAAAHTQPHPPQREQQQQQLQRHGGGSGGGGGGGGCGVAGAVLLHQLVRLYGELGLPGEGLVDLLLHGTNKRGQTCLHAAAASGNGAAMRLLLGLSPGLSPGPGPGPGCCDPLRPLLRLRLPAALLRTDKSGRTALHLAAAAGSEECVRLLLGAAEAGEGAAEAKAEVQQGGDGAAVAEAAMASSSRSGSPPPPPPEQQQQQQQLGSAPSSSAPSSSSSSLSGPPSPPLRARRQQPSAAAGTIVSRLVSATDAAGLTALHFTAAANCLPVVRLLLSAGSPYTAQTAVDNLEASMPCNAGWTVLHVAALKGHLDVVVAVLSHHSSLSSEDQVAGWTPGKHCRSSDPRVLTDRRGTTASRLAASRGFTDLAALLDPATPLTQAVRGALGAGGPVGPDGAEVRPPAMFVCPITQEVLRDPVVASDGFTYERAAISRWLSAGRSTSPMTNLPLPTRALYPNNVIKSAIKEWRQQHQLPDPDAPRSRSARRLYGNNLYGTCNGPGGGGGRDSFLTHLRAHGL